VERHPVTGAGCRYEGSLKGAGIVRISIPDCSPPFGVHLCKDSVARKRNRAGKNAMTSSRDVPLDGKCLPWCYLNDSIAGHFETDAGRND
jgi:hypothetical protein